MKRRLLAILCMLAAAACPALANETLFAASSAPVRTLVVDSTTDIGVIRPVIEAFQAQNPSIEVRYNELETIGLHARTAAACAKGEWSSDLVISSAMDLQVKLVNDGCATALDSPPLRLLPAYAQWRGELFGLTFEPAVIVYNRRLIAPTEVPTDHFALLDLLRQPDRFAGRIGTYDIETSGLGYLYATLDSQQSSTWGRLIEAFGRNRVQLFCCTSDILERVADGRLTFGYNVLGSYAFAQAAANPDLAVVLPSDYTLVLTRAAYVPKTARNAADAIALMAFTQSDAGRAILNGSARLFSAIDGATALFRQAGISEEARSSLRPIALSPALLAGLDSMKRSLFLAQWRESLAVKQD